MAATFDVREISYGIVERREPKTQSVRFDDGNYELRMKRGLNSDLQTWDVPIEAVFTGWAETIEQFLAAHNGVDWFWWTPPRQTQPRKFICRRWTREPVRGSRTHDRLTLTLEEVADLG
jgi:phage-related protein